MNLLLLFATGWAMDHRNVQYSPEEAAVIIGYLRKAGQDIPLDLLNMQPRNNGIQNQNNVINIQNDSIDIIDYRWTCSTCTFINLGSQLDKCEMCEIPKPALINIVSSNQAESKTENTALIESSKGWTCSTCTFINLGSQLDKCEMCEIPKPALINIVSSNQAESKTENTALIESSIVDLSLNSVQLKNQALPEGFEKPALTGSDFKNVESEEQTKWKRSIGEKIWAGEFVDDVTLSRMMYSNPIESATMIHSSMKKQEIAEQIKETYWYTVDDNWEYKNFWSIKQRALVKEFIDLLDEAALKSKNLFSVLKDFERKAWLAIPYGFRGCPGGCEGCRPELPAKKALVLFYGLQNPKLPKQDDQKKVELLEVFVTWKAKCQPKEQNLLQQMQNQLSQEL